MATPLIKLSLVVLFLCCVVGCQTIVVPPPSNTDENAPAVEVQTSSVTPSPTLPIAATPSTGLLPHDITLTPPDQRR